MPRCRIRMRCARKPRATFCASTATGSAWSHPDVGGAFGLKEAPGPELILALLGARRLQRPVLWVSDRAESFVSDFHARDNHTTVELALDRDGHFLALRVDTIANIGAYISLERPAHPDQQSRGLVGRLSHAGDFRPRHRGFHQHAADRALSRRRPSGGHLRHRTDHRRCGAAAGPGSGRAAAQEPDRAGPDAVRHGFHVHLRFRRIRAQHGRRAGARATGRALRGAARPRPRAAGSPASACRIRSRSRPARSPARCPRARTSVSIPPAA